MILMSIICSYLKGLWRKRKNNARTHAPRETHSDTLFLESCMALKCFRTRDSPPHLFLRQQHKPHNLVTKNNPNSTYNTLPILQRHSEAEEYKESQLKAKHKAIYLFVSILVMEKEGNGTAAPSSRRSLVPAKKRGGAVSLLRAVILAFRGNSSKKAPDASTAVKTIVNGMRPLYQLDYQRRLPPPPPPPMALDSYYDVHLPPPSPCSSDATSRYASAEDLQALDTSEDNEEGASSNGELNAIDMKAEEFIAMFYKQMKLQRSDSLKMVDEEAIEQHQPQSLKMIEEEEMVIEGTAEGATRLLQQEEKASVEETSC